jgi:hypothetical protein
MDNDTVTTSDTRNGPFVSAPQPLPKRFFYVARVYEHQDGGTVFDSRLSRRIERAGVLMRVLKRIRRDTPSAYGIEVRQYR